jgi:Mg2+ and Co2+ transporter CorA
LGPGDAGLQAALSSRFAIPKWLWRTKEQDQNGYFYGASLPPTVRSKPKKHTTVFRFMVKYITEGRPRVDNANPYIFYDWYVLTFATYWTSTGESVLLCFNVPVSLKAGIQRSLDNTKRDNLTSHPFGFHPVVLEQVTELYDHAVWQFRDCVRNLERYRPTLESPVADYTAMHELARHTMHSSEVLTTGLNVMENMLANVDSFYRCDALSPNASDPEPAIRHQRSVLQFMLNRSRALEDRLRNEINLAFHITSQHTNMLSTEIARAAKIDSTATKTISVLGLFFLPATFVSAVFSMSFFNYTPPSSNGQGEWRVSGELWVYWVVAIPVTAVTVALWWWWQRCIARLGDKATKRTRLSARERINPWSNS